MAVTTDKSAPYAPARTVLDVVARHRARGFQGSINAEVLGRIGVSDSLIARTLQALTALDLIDDQGAPTKTFESLRLAPEADYPARMADWLNGAYADVLTFIDPATATDTQIRDAFRPYKPSGQQDRMVSLFTGLYSAAGVRAQEHAEVTKPRAAAPARPRPAQPSRSFRAAGAAKAKPKLSVNDGAFAGLHPMLAALLNDLPTPGTGWSQEKRDKVVKMFPTVLDFAFPIIEPGQEGEDEQDPFA